MGRPAKKKAYWESKSAEKGKLQAHVEAERKKPLEISAREHIGKIMDNTTISDLGDIVAAVGLTFAVHEAIISAKSLFDKVMKICTAPITLLEQAASGNVLGVANVYLDAIHDWIPFLGQFVPHLGTSTTTGKLDISADVFLWLISFGIAYVIVKHAGQLVGLLNTGLTGIITLLVGA